ncbi:hypothetical protein [Sphingomonas sp.]|uniref:hypothetical protein n=1 Tax=Sphingomonas sp. TaxID=28214 RepID=UPI003B3B6FDF
MAEPNLEARARELRVGIQRALLSELGDTYDCTRVWGAWSVGTMDQDDFVPVLDRLDELIAAILFEVEDSLSIAALQFPTPTEAASSAAFQQRRGRLPDLIEGAIEIYDGFMKDDDYDTQRCLDRVIAKLKSARDWYDATPTPTNVEPGGRREALCRMAALDEEMGLPDCTPEEAVEAVAAVRTNVKPELVEALEAMKPFADCASEYIAADEDDEEWAKFRLIVKDWRRLEAAYSALSAHRPSKGEGA